MNPTSEERFSTADFVAGSEIQKVDKSSQETDQVAPLFPEHAVQDFKRRWSEIQGAFVDQPREALQHADELVAMILKRLAEGFAEQRGNLEKQWSRGGDVSTEDLRIALRKYRAFFERLLAIQTPASS